MKTYYITFFSSLIYPLTFKGTIEDILKHLSENKELIEELTQKPEFEAMFYYDPNKRYYWLADSRASYNDIYANIALHGISKPKNTISILERI